MKEIKNWRKIENEDGYEVYLLQINYNYKTATITVDNFSVYPVTVQNYDCMTLEIDEDWINVFDKPLVQFKSYEEGLAYFKTHFSNELYDDIVKFLKRQDYKIS